MNTKQARKYRGDGMALAAADLVILIPVFILAFYTICDVAILAVYKFRLSNIAIMAAGYATELPVDQDIPAETQRMSEEMARRSLLPASKMKVSTKFDTTTEAELVEVEISGEFPLLVGYSLPTKITLTEKACAPMPANRVHAVLGISPYPYAQETDAAKPCVYIPIVRPSHSLPVWTFPFDTSLNYLRVIQGSEPDLARRNGSEKFLERPSIY